MTFNKTTINERRAHIMKHVFILTVIVGGYACSSPGNSGQTEGHDHSSPSADASAEAPKSKSPKTMAMDNIGDNHVHIEYSSPSVRGRLIFGGLVAFDEVWVTGAHRATSITFQNDVVIGEKEVPAGKYGFFTIPGKEEWTIVLSKDWDMHLADDYDAANDLLRMTVLPEKLTETVESLTYEVIPGENNSGSVTMSWADIKIAFEVENK